MTIREDLDNYKAQANRAEVKCIQLERQVKELSKRINTAETDQARSEAKVNKAVSYLRKQTNISVIGGYHKSHKSQIIVTGQYCNKDYVEIFNVPHDAIPQMIEQLRDLRDTGTINRIDVPHPTKQMLFEHGIF